MTQPIVLPSDLATYLQRTDLNPDQAELMLALAQELCEGIVNPLPVGARSVVLAVAARAITNVTSAHQMGLGAAQISFGSSGSRVGIGGMFLSRSDKATLRRLAGRTGAFSVDLLPQP